MRSATQLLNRNIQTPPFFRVLFSQLGKTAIFFGEKRLGVLIVIRSILLILLAAPVFVLGSIFLYHFNNVSIEETNTIIGNIVMVILLVHNLYYIFLGVSYSWFKTLKKSYQSLNSDNLISHSIINLAYVIVLGTIILNSIEVDPLTPITLDVNQTFDTLNLLLILLLSFSTILALLNVIFLLVVNKMKHKIILEQLRKLSARATTTIDESIPRDLNQDVVNELILREAE